MPLFGGASKPFHRFDEVLAYSHTLAIARTEVELRIDLSPFDSETVPLDDFGEVSGHARTRGIATPKVALCRNIPLLSAFRIVLRTSSFILAMLRDLALSQRISYKLISRGIRCFFQEGSYGFFSFGGFEPKCDECELGISGCLRCNSLLLSFPR